MLRSVRAFLQRKALLRSGLSLLLGLLWLALLLSSYTGYGETDGGGGANTFSPVNDGICVPEVEPQLTNILFVQPNYGVCPNSHEKTSHFLGHASDFPDSHVKSKDELQDYTTSATEQGEAETKGDRVSRDRPPKLDEFKHKSVTPKEKSVPVQSASIVHRVEPSGIEYNYASDSKGAKVLAYNKEAKGASNILGKDVDKYLRNPCSTEVKFVIIELSEETLVCTIEIANFEHYSSNLKDFEVLGSLVYPTENWVRLENFTAKNIKQTQRFRLEEPKWVRYLKLDLLSHYGSEFYCTLSTVKVYGVDAVEQMLEDLISVQNHVPHSDEPVEEKRSTLPQPLPSQTDELHQDYVSENYTGLASADSKLKYGAYQGNSGDQLKDMQPHHAGRVAGDSVLKILVQKVQSLDLNLSILERYLEELNSRYGNLFKELDEEVAEKAVILEKMRLDVTNLLDNMDTTVKDVSDLVSWKSLVSSKIDILSGENEILRSQMERIVNYQGDLENKHIVVLLLTFIIGTLSAIKLVTDFSVNMFTRKQEFTDFCRSKISWIFLFLNCATAALILLL